MFAVTQTVDYEPVATVLCQSFQDACSAVVDWMKDYLRKFGSEDADARLYYELKTVYADGEESVPDWTAPQTLFELQRLCEAWVTIDKVGRLWVSQVKPALVPA